MTLSLPSLACRGSSCNPAEIKRSQNRADKTSRVVDMIERSHYAKPFLPKQFIAINPEGEMCTQHGNYVPGKNTGGRCFDIRSVDHQSAWRIRVARTGGPGLIERIFKSDNGQLVLWTIFDNSHQNGSSVTYASDEARQFAGTQNADPVTGSSQGIAPKGNDPVENLLGNALRGLFGR